MSRIIQCTLAGLWLSLSIFYPCLAAERQVLLLEVKGAIGPAVSDFVRRGIEQGEESGAELVILRMDTPGGLDSSMRDIVHKILSASLPVVTYVAPSGSRAASAGTYILYASHLAAMAPATNLGAATPVQMAPTGLPGGDKEPGKDQEDAGEAMERKVVNDAVAYIQGLARMRGRNAEWAEKAVREAVSLTAEDALQQGVIEVLAADVASLLTKLHGRQVMVAGVTRTLHTDQAIVVAIEPDWRSRLLAIITNPNVAYVLMLLGIYGLFFELSNPGTILPGVVGAICLLLALYAFQVLPVNYAGLALILVGTAFMLGEVFMPSFGALGIGGAIAFVVGSLILLEAESEFYALSVPLVFGFALFSVAFFMTVTGMALQQRGRPSSMGQEAMPGSLAEVVDAEGTVGRVWVHSELWQARAAVTLTKGQKVRVRAMEGLTLLVEPVQQGKTENQA